MRKSLGSRTTLLEGRTCDGSGKFSRCPAKQREAGRRTLCRARCGGGAQRRWYAEHRWLGCWRATSRGHLSVCSQRGMIAWGLLHRARWAWWVGARPCGGLAHRRRARCSCVRARGCVLVAAQRLPDLSRRLIAVSRLITGVASLTLRSRGVSSACCLTRACSRQTRAGPKPRPPSRREALICRGRLQLMRIALGSTTLIRLSFGHAHLSTAIRSISTPRAVGRDGGTVHRRGSDWRRASAGIAHGARGGVARGPLYGAGKPSRTLRLHQGCPRHRGAARPATRPPGSS